MKLHRLEGNQLAFNCPGCKEVHAISVEPGRWTWNGSLTEPTINPSILSRSGHYAPQWAGPDCWCTYAKKHPDEPTAFECGVCHSFVRDGKIQFLADCTHALAGHTVDIPEWETQ